MKQTLFLPQFASTAQLLFDATNCSMALFISENLLNVLLVFPIKLSLVVSTTVSAPKGQTVFCGTIYAKHALAFPFPAPDTELLLSAIDRAMRFFIPVVFLCHSPLIPCG